MEKKISERLHTELAMRGWSVAEFAERCNLPIETVKNLYYGRTAEPKVSTLLKMGDVLGLSVNCLLGRCPHTQDEQKIIKYYRQCGTHGKSIIGFVAKYEAVSAKAEREAVDKHKIPCLIPQGNIREGIIYDRCESTEIFTTDKRAYTAIQMTNNDLVPAYCKGDIILIENRFPNSHEYGAFFKDDRAYIREYVEEDGQYRLRCLHNQGEDILLNRMDEIEYIGTCIGVVRA